jgi:hypothetical protein
MLFLTYGFLDPFDRVLCDIRIFYLILVFKWKDLISELLTKLEMISEQEKQKKIFFGGGGVRAYLSKEGGSVRLTANGSPL